jgi:16S rRNA (cytidine1402-2'-O)-methyltransferase
LLILVATPIGNLADITLRAIEELKQADLILCEDTRHSATLFAKYGISGQYTSYGAHNVHSKLPWIMAQLRAGKRVAVISDAGTPGISDPGTVLVSAALAEKFPVTAIPGPAAIIPALVLSGLPTDRFVFEGFLPHKKGRQTRLRELAQETRTIVLYESPHRLVKTLTELHDHLGDRRISVARELTKVYEEVIRGTLSSVADHFREAEPRGEFVLVIAGARDRRAESSM